MANKRNSFIVVLGICILLLQITGALAYYCDAPYCISTGAGVWQEGLINDPGICIGEVKPGVTRIRIECLDEGFEAVIWEGLPVPGDFIDTLGCNAI